VWWLFLNGFFSSINFEKNNIKLYDLDKPAMHGGGVIQQKSVEESKKGKDRRKSYL
jgi:hypothetical protein